MTSFDQIIAGADDQPQASFNAIARIAQDVMGCTLMTAIRWDLKADVCQRMITTMPGGFAENPVMPIRWGDWADLVLKGHDIYVANDPEAMRWAFPNVDDIVAAGGRSILNLPIIAAGEVIGTVNILNQDNYFTGDVVAKAKAELLLPAAAAFLLERQLRAAA